MFDIYLNSWFHWDEYKIGSLSGSQLELPWYFSPHIIVETNPFYWALFCTITQDKGGTLWLCESETLTYTNPKSGVILGPPPRYRTFLDTEPVQYRTFLNMEPVNTEPL